LSLSKPIMVLLITSDKEQFIVDKDIAEHSAMIKATLERKLYLVYLVIRHRHFYTMAS
jgi:hypothetical protein